MKKAFISLLIVICVLVVSITVYMMEYSTPVRAVQEKVAYTLPYPGILPDNPLYVLKNIRDNLLEWGTRDNLKKAELYLLFSDKKIAMSQLLAKKNKQKQAIDTAALSEKYFMKIPKLLMDAKKQGAASSSEFVDNLKLSNAKHKEILDTFLREFPQGSMEEINTILKNNNAVRNALQTL